MGSIAIFATKFNEIKNLKHDFFFFFYATDQSQQFIPSLMFVIIGKLFRYTNDT